jgi:hypothetical protein
MGGACRIGGHPDRCHGVATRVEDVERPSVGCDDHVEGLVAYWDGGQDCVGPDVDRSHGVVALVGDVSRLAIRSDDDGDGLIADRNRAVLPCWLARGLESQWNR